MKNRGYRIPGGIMFLIGGIVMLFTGIPLIFPDTQSGAFVLAIPYIVGGFISFLGVLTIITPYVAPYVLLLLDYVYITPYIIRILEYIVKGIRNMRNTPAN